MKDRYDLSEVLKRLGLSGGQIRQITHNRKSERAYQAELRKLVRRIARSIQVVPSDAALSKLATQARREAARARAAATKGAETILNAEARSHRQKWIRSVKSSLGVDLSRVVKASSLDTEWNEVLRRNSRLIKDLADDVADRVQQVVSRATLNGDSATRVSQSLREQFAITGRRADVIARDQIAKAVSDLNMLRQTQAGVEKYIWSTSADERVRDSHAELNGKVFRWDRPGPDNGNHPGQAIMCRCVPIAIVDD